LVRPPRCLLLALLLAGFFLRLVLVDVLFQRKEGRRGQSPLAWRRLLPIPIEFRCGSLRRWRLLPSPFELRPREPTPILQAGPARPTLHLTLGVPPPFRASALQSVKRPYGCPSPQPSARRGNIKRRLKGRKNTIYGHFGPIPAIKRTSDNKNRQ